MLSRVQKPMVELGMVVCLASGVGLADTALALERPKGAERTETRPFDLQQQTVDDRPSQSVDEEGKEDVPLVDEKQDESKQVLSESADAAEAQESEDFPVRSKSKSDGQRVTKPTGGLRLPRYFAGLVDQQQRLQIQEIQLQFRARIAELEEQLNQLQQQEAEALEQVLTDSQRKLLEKKRNQATVTRTKAGDSTREKQQESELSSQEKEMKEHPDPTESAATEGR